jgi:hypothetical protein
VQPVDHWVSKPESSRSSMSYSHQRVSFSISRISTNVLMNVVLPFNLVTNLTGVSACLASTDTRLQVITTIFMAAVGLRYVSATFLPRVSYATFLDQYMWSCLIFVAAAAVVSMLSASVPWAVQLSAPAPFSSLDANAWMTLLFLWVVWNAWLLLCFTDHMCGGRRWRNVHYLYTQRSSRVSEEQEMTWARRFRTLHLTQFSPIICCSRRSPLNCVACTEGHLGALRAARRSLLDAEEAFYTPLNGAAARRAAEKRRHDARAAEEKADALVSAGCEGSRIGSGRILCEKHLKEYYNSDMQRDRRKGCSLNGCLRRVAACCTGGVAEDAEPTTPGSPANS